MNICFLLPEFPRSPSGGALVVYQYANHLVAKGHNVQVLHIEDGIGSFSGAFLRRLRRARQNLAQGGLTDRIRWTYVDPRIAMWRGPSSDLAAFADLDLVVATFWTTVEVGLELVDSAGAELVHFVQGYEVWSSADVDAVQFALTRNVRKIVVSYNLANSLVGLGVDRTLIAVVQNGIDTRRFCPSSQSAGRDVSLAFAASDVPVKGTRTAVKVLSKLKVWYPGLKVVTFGPGRRPNVLPEYVEYHRALNHSGLARLVYDRAAVFMCTSESEGWGLPVLEAMACGCAVVTTRNGGVEDFALDGVSALLAPVGDADALAEKVSLLLSDSELCAEVALRGVDQARLFDVRVAAEEFELRLLR